MATKAHLTVEDFVRLPESVGGRDVRYELVEGELVTVSPAMFPHNRVRDNVLVTLMRFLQDGKLGMVISLQAFHLFGNTVRTPGVAFIRSGRDLAKDRPIEGAPDLAIEVVSPTNINATSTISTNVEEIAIRVPKFLAWQPERS